VPDTDTTAPWRLASEEINRPARYRITTGALDGVQPVQRDADGLTVGSGLIVQPE
jgi:hypothetical protein